MSIKRITVAFTLALSAIVVVMVALDLRGLVNELRRSADLQQTTVTTAILNKAVIELSLERSLLQATLSLPVPIPDPFARMVEAQRAASDDLFAKVTERLAGEAGRAEVAAFLDELARYRATIGDIRVAADANLARHHAERDAAFVAALPQTMPAVIEGMARLGERLSVGRGEVPSAVVGQERVQRLAWAIRE